IFPGHKEGRPVGDNSVWRLAKRAAESNITVHGLRATFRIWAAERTSFSSEVAEAALAHAVPDAVVASYKRTDFFSRRRKCMGACSAVPRRSKAARSLRCTPANRIEIARIG